MDQTEPKHILVIDDDPDFLEFVTIVLQAANYRVTVASSAPAGLQSMSAEPPDLVIADVMMSLSLDGLVIDHQMAQDPLLCDVPLLMVSAIISDSDAIARKPPETRRYAGLMRKPLGPSVLLQRVAEILVCEE